MSTPSLAKTFFERITTAPNPTEFLKSLVTDQQTEEEWLDFKGAPGVGHPEADVKTTWSKAFSGFANSGGGVLVWGIDARKNEQNIDCAGELALIKNPAALKSRLQELFQAADPPVLDVAITEYTDPASNEGFVVCLIPESRFKPHRAQLANAQFYIRVNTSFAVASVSTLRTLFYPRSRAYLRARARFNFQLQANRQFITWTFQIHNTGTATARDVRLVLGIDFDPSQIWGGPGFERDINAQRFTFDCQRPIHPGTSRDAVVLQEPGPGFQGHKSKFTFLIYAHDHEPQAAEVSFETEDFANQNSKFAVPIDFPE